MSTKSKRIYYKMLLEEKFNLPPVPNGIIDSSIRLACALRYFAGGSTYDLAPLYGISHTEVFNSVWYVVEAVNSHAPFFIEYPADITYQLKIAKDFKDVSAIPFGSARSLHSL
jgi:hypothetical protein